MITGFKQSYSKDGRGFTGVRIGYINEKGSVSVKSIPTSFSNWEICSEDEAETDIRQFKTGEAIKRVEATSFKGANLREFLTKTISKEDQDLIYAYNIPYMFSMDTEIDLSEANGFPKPEEAKYPIETIQICTMEFAIVVFCKSEHKQYNTQTDHIFEKHHFDGDGKLTDRHTISIHLHRFNRRVEVEVDRGMDMEDITKKVNDTLISKSTFSYFKRMGENTYSVLSNGGCTLTSALLRNVGQSPRSFQRDVEDEINKYVDQVAPPHVKEAIKKYATNGRISYNIANCSNEREMLTNYLSKRLKVMNCIIGWNLDGFDSPYIRNRCKVLGIDMAKYSPIESVDRDGNPEFLVDIDYMITADKFSGNYIKGSKALDYVAGETLKIKKVHYTGSFKALLKDYYLFMFYGGIDPFLVQMIHRLYNYNATPLTMSYYAKIPINKAMSTTAIASALWVDELYTKRVFNANYARDESGKVDFVGGYVMSPRRKKVGFTVIFDYKSLYPSSIRTGNYSPDALLYKINMANAVEFKKAKDLGHAISQNGNIYSNTTINSLNSIVTRLVEERYYYKGIMLKVYNLRKGLEEKYNTLNGSTVSSAASTVKKKNRVLYKKGYLNIHK